MKIRKKLHQYDCLIEYFYMNEITKKIQLSDYVQESQVLHGFQKSKLMLYNSVPKKPNNNINNLTRHQQREGAIM